MSNQASSRTPRGGLRSGATPVPQDVARPLPESPSSADGVSTLTTPNRSHQQRHGARDRERIDDLPLADLAADNPISPLERMDAIQEEDQYDAVLYQENPGADDSEDEDETGMGVLNAALVDAQAERREETEASAGINFAKYLEDYNRQLQEQKEEADLANNAAENNNNNDIPGAPVGWKRPGPKPGWKPLEPKHGQPPFAEVDNPGGWSEFTYRPKFGGSGGGPYLYHALPTGARPVPLQPNGKRKVGGWDFHYQGWENPQLEPRKRFRSNATRDNPFPEYRKGSLCGETLSKLGLTQMRMLEDDGAPDALFFHQLLLPMHDTSKTVPGDPRQSYYPENAKWTNVYAADLGLMGSGYGHKFDPVDPTEMLKWDGSVLQDGVRGGSNGAILRRMDKRKGNAAYDKPIANTFSKSRWLEIKRCIKLCKNDEPKNKRDHVLYNPAYKYDYIYQTIVHNVNALTLFCGLDLCGDESTFGFNGWGEAGSGLLGLIANKPGVTRGGQIVMVSDVDRIRPRAYIHRHRLHERQFDKGRPGQSEVKLLWQALEPLCQPNNQYRPHALFRELPHMTWDNYFCGDELMDYAATVGFGLTMTCRRDALPAGIPAEYLQKKKTDSEARSRAARFERPIFCIKSAGTGGSCIQLMTFQSTSSCNIIHVNALNTLDRYGEARECGRGNQKRKWAIEMNESRKLYLKTYGGIDRLDHLIQNCSLGYR